MIDYEVLCQSIEDWRAGRRPSAAIPGPTAAPSPYEQVDSDVVEMDDDEMQVEMEGEHEFGEQSTYGGDGEIDGAGTDAGDTGYGDDGGYADHSHVAEAGAPGEAMGPTGTPPAYTTEMPPPYDAGQPAPYTEMIPTHDTSEDVDISDEPDEREP